MLLLRRFTPEGEIMKITQLCFAALAACLMFAGQASADVIVSSTEPTTDILLDQFHFGAGTATNGRARTCLLYTSPSPRD